MLKINLLQSYDLTLYSDTTSNKVSELTDGNLFEVRVPIGDDLKGKKLVAYYVNSNNEIEEHDIVVVDDIGSFTTNHFSIYTIAEKEEVTSSGEQPVISEDPLDENVPSTYDSVVNYIIVGTVGLIGLGTGLILKKREN